MKKQFTLITALALCMGLAAPAMAVTTTSAPAGNTATLRLENNTGSMTISGYVAAKEETWVLDGETETIVWYEVDDDTTITFDAKSDKVSGGIGSIILEDGKYLSAGDAYLGDEWGWPELNAKELVAEHPLREVFMLDFGNLIDSEMGYTYDGITFYIRAADESQVPAKQESFTDVSADAYFANPVKWAVEKKITAGTTPTTFSPEVTCSHAHILTFLWNAAGCPNPTISNPFTNITADAYYYKAALWAYENGMLSGNTFNGNLPCTRSETVTYLWQAAGKPSVTKETTFTDVAGNAAYAQAVAWAVDAKVTAGTSATTFSPDATCTRGQIVTFLYNAFAAK